MLSASPQVKIDTEMKVLGDAPEAQAIIFINMKQPTQNTCKLTTGVFKSVWGRFLLEYVVGRL